MADVIKLLNQYGQLIAQADALRLSVDEKRTEIMRPVQEALDALNTETIPQLTAMQDSIKTLADEIKAETIKGGQSVKGVRFQAIYLRGRTTWDHKALDGYAAAHPEILPFKEVGEPSVSIRATSN